MTKLFAASGQKSKDNNTELWSREGRIYELVQPKQLFYQMCRSQKARDWLVMTHDDGEDIHFVVGYRTFFDATESDRSTKSSKADVKATFPTSDTVAPGSGGVPTGNTLDVELSGGHSSKSHGEESFEIPGERIFAICFREVKFKWFKAGQAESARLGKDNTWVVTSVNRGKEGEGDTMVEVEVGDEDVGGDGESTPEVVQNGTILEEYYIPCDDEDEE